MIRSTKLILSLALSFPLILSSPLPPSLPAQLLSPLSPPHFGAATLFTPGLGACGQTDSASSPVAALPSSVFTMELCDRYLLVGGNGTVGWGYAKVRDECTTCLGEGVDLSQAVFRRVAGSDGVGEVQVQWQFMPEGWVPVGILPEVVGELQGGG